MNRFKRNLDWYQSKIGDHDKQNWEQTVEGKISTSIDSLPKRDFVKPCRELLDVDLIKGSTFTKAAPSHTSYVRTWKGLVRLLFLPFFYKWWVQHTTRKFFWTALLLYAAQVLVTVVYLYSSVDMTISLFEVTNPLMFMFVLSVIHTQIVYTQSSTKTHLFKKTSTTKASVMPPLVQSKRSQGVKRIKKVPSKLAGKRKAKNSPLPDIKSKLLATSKASAKTSKCVRTAEYVEKMENTKLLSESSEEVEEPLSSARRTEDNADTDRDTFEDHDFEDDEGSVCSNGEEAIPPTYKLHADKLTTLPDVAITARTAHANNRHNVLLSQKLKLKCNKDRVISPTGESEETSDLDSPNKVWTSDNEWENNRVCNSDVADNSSDSSSEYVSDNQPEDDLSAEGPISLKEKLPNSLAYVPSFYDRITCIVWENGVCKKVDLSVVELGGQIERQVANIDYDSNELLFCALLFSVLIASFPFLFRFYHSPDFRAKVVDILLERQSLDVNAVRNSLSVLFGTTWQELVILINGVIQRLFLCAVFCFLISVAEKSYWQRLQFAKFFCYLTSARKSCKHGVPHFRLNKVKNIKIWLSLRAYLKKRGPQRSVEVIVGSVFGLMVVFLAAMCVQLLSDIESFIRLYGNWELSLCCLALMIYLLRFYSLGTRITKKYRNLSTIITEQINLYLHMEQKPYKKEELLVANAVLKLAESLIKEIESPYKMSTTVINPVVFNVTRVAMLSAFSAVISELLGFKLKLHKVKIG